MGHRPNTTVITVVIQSYLTLILIKINTATQFYTLFDFMKGKINYVCPEKERNSQLLSLHSLHLRNSE